MPQPDLGAASLDTLSDLCTPWCIHVVATLRIAEHVAAGTADVQSLAEMADCAPDPLYAVLVHLANKGVFERTGPGRFALNDAARGLLEPGRHLGLDLHGIGGRMAQAWATLLPFVRTGRPAYQEAFGLSFWEDPEAHPEVGASFDALMGPTGHGSPDPIFDLTGGWAHVRSVVDVGGGTGAMLAELLRARPAIHGTLVDLPQTAARAAATFAHAGVADRLRRSVKVFSRRYRPAATCICFVACSTTGRIVKPLPSCGAAPRPCRPPVESWCSRV